MDHNAIIAVPVGILAGLIVKNKIRAEKAKRKEIRLKTEKEIAAIRAAGEIVKNKIRSGEVKTMDQAMKDLEFYKIMLLEK